MKKYEFNYWNPILYLIIAVTIILSVPYCLLSETSLKNFYIDFFSLFKEKYIYEPKNIFIKLYIVSQTL